MINMKKIGYSLLFTGSLLIFISFGSGNIVHATDNLTGNTKVGAEVIKGDVSLTVDQTVDFGKQPLSQVVDFGSKDINYVVTDYSGTTNGYELSAKLTDTDNTRSLKVQGVELSNIASPVMKKTMNSVGDNNDKVSSSLKYTGVTKAQKYSSSIEWNLTKVSTKQISE